MGTACLRGGIAARPSQAHDRNFFQRDPHPQLGGLARGPTPGCSVAIDARRYADRQQLMPAPSHSAATCVSAFRVAVVARLVMSTATPNGLDAAPLRGSRPKSRHRLQNSAHPLVSEPQDVRRVGALNVRHRNLR